MNLQVARGLSAAGLAAVLLTGAACGSTQPAASTTAAAAGSAGTVKIGAIFPYSGAVSIYGKPMEDGLRLAIDEINAAGGIGGKKVQLVTGDSQSTPRGTAEATRRLISQDNVDVLVGPVQSNDRDAMAQVAKQLNRVVFYPAKWEGGTCSPDVVYLGPAAYQQYKQFIPWAMKRAGKTWYLLGADYDFPRIYFKYVKRVIASDGGKVIGEQFYPLGTSDWSSAIQKVAQVKPDILLAGTVGPDLTSFMKQAQQYGLKQRVKMITGLTFDATEVAGMGNAAVGVIEPDNYRSSLDTPASQKFVAAFRKRYGANVPIDQLVEASYASGYAIKAAIEKAGGKTDPKDLMAAVDNLTVQAPEGPLTIMPDHQAAVTMRIWKLGANGQDKVVQDFGKVGNPNSCAG